MKWMFASKSHFCRFLMDLGAPGPSKMAPESFQESPKPFQDPPKTSKDGPKTPPRRPLTLQDAPKARPRRAQDAPRQPKTPQDPQRRPQDLSKAQFLKVSKPLNPPSLEKQQKNVFLAIVPYFF